MVALYDEAQALPLPDMYSKNLTFKTGGVDGCDCAEILSLIEAGKIDTTPLITHRFRLENIEEAYRIFENKLDRVIKIAITPNDEPSEKEMKYRDLIARVKESYPPRDPADDGKELRLYWCEDCEEINLWTYWQGRGNLDAKVMLVGQDWGCPWDAEYLPTLEQVRRANDNQEYDYLNNNPSPTDNNLARLFAELGYDIGKQCSELFFTNFVLGYRAKGFSSGFKISWAEHDKGYFKELANVIEPKVILCLGRSTFEGVLSAFAATLPTRIKGYNSFVEGTNNPVEVTLESGETAYVFALAHCGAMGTLNRNGKKSTDLGKQLDDWRKIRPYLDK